MSNLQQGKGKMTNYRWTIVSMLFLATTVNYLDRQVLSLTWADFIAPEFGWTNSDYGTITGLFSLFYAVSMLFAGKFIDWIDTKKGFLWAIGVSVVLPYRTTMSISEFSAKRAISPP